MDDSLLDPPHVLGCFMLLLQRQERARNLVFNAAAFVCDASCKREAVTNDGRIKSVIHSDAAVFVSLR